MSAIRPILQVQPGVVPETAKFLDIPKLGQTCYHEFGPEDGKPVILIHGLGWWSYMWLDHIETLTKEGLRVITYDCLARGFSAAPPGPYTAKPYLAQLHALVTHLRLSKVSIVGFSMGGCIALLYASKYPDQVASLVTLAPAGLPMAMPFLARLITVPVLGYSLYWLAGTKAMLARMNKDRFSLDIAHTDQVTMLPDCGHAIPLEPPCRQHALAQVARFVAN